MDEVQKPEKITANISIRRVVIIIPWFFTELHKRRQYRGLLQTDMETIVICIMAK